MPTVTVHKLVANQQTAARSLLASLVQLTTHLEHYPKAHPLTELSILTRHAHQLYVALADLRDLYRPIDQNRTARHKSCPNQLPLFQTNPTNEDQ